MILFLATKALEFLFQTNISDDFKSIIAFFSFFELGFEIFIIILFLIALPVFLIDAITSRGDSGNA